MRRCVEKRTGEEFAIKTIRKARVSRVEHLRREVEILRRVSHPNIIELHEVFEDEVNLHLVRVRDESCRKGFVQSIAVEVDEGVCHTYSPGGLGGIRPLSQHIHEVCSL